jgi:hypothetical protein
MLVDQFNALKKANAELNAQGEKTTPVWKQMLSGIFSWQTALSVGITLITVYGKEIGNLISGLFGVKNANEDLIKTQDDYNKSLDDTIERVSKLNKEQISDLDFATKMKILDMKKRKATDKEIFDFEQQQRENAIQKAIDAQDKITQKEREALEKRLQIQNALYDDAGNKDLKDALDKAKEAEEKLAAQRQSYAEKEEKLRQDKASANATFEYEQLVKEEERKEKAAKDAKDRNDKRKLERDRLIADNAKKVSNIVDKTLKKEFKDIENDAKEKQRLEEERLKNEQAFRDKMNQLIADMEEDQAREDERLAKKKFDEEQKRFKDSINALQQFSNDRNAIKMREIERDIDLSRRSETEIQAIALQGSEDA